MSRSGIGPASSAPSPHSRALRWLQTQAVFQSRSLVYGLAKVASREFSPGASFQVPLEPNRGFFLVEFNADEGAPWPMLRGVRRQPRVVRSEPRVGIRSEADVVLVRVIQAFQNVNESLSLRHSGHRNQMLGHRSLCVLREELSPADRFWYARTETVTWREVQENGLPAGAS